MGSPDLLTGIRRRERRVGAGFLLNYVTQAQWWRMGFIISLLHLAIWLPIGFLWWKAIGLW